MRSAFQGGGWTVSTLSGVIPMAVISFPELCEGWIWKDGVRNSLERAHGGLEGSSVKELPPAAFEIARHMNGIIQGVKIDAPNNQRNLTSLGISIPFHSSMRYW